MKNPNGYGSIIKLSGKRRKPFAIVVTKGWDDTGKQKREYIGYYETRAKAMLVLAEFNANPYDLAASGLTFAEIYEKFSLRKFEKISSVNIYGYKTAFKHSKPLHNVKFSDIRAMHLQEIIDNCKTGHASKSKIKVLFKQLYKYAMENDIVQKDYSSFIDIGENTRKTDRKPFTAEEIKTLWENLGDLEHVDTILIMIYTGMRIGELITLENSKINIEERIMQGGIKTAAGIDRLIPINLKLVPLIEKRYDANSKYLIRNAKGKALSYDTYYEYLFKPIMEKLKMNHRPHDARHTFATLMDNAGANKLSIKKIMGHSVRDITDGVYTHKDIDELLKAIDFI